MPSNVVQGWINKIFLKGTTTTEEFNIGTTFDQVHFSEENGYTLANLSAFLRQFFGHQMFMRYCGQEPSSYKVMEWYQVVPASDQNNRTSDEEISSADDYADVTYV